MPFSNTVADQILNDNFRDEPLFLALYKTSPTAADTGTEVSGGGYARQAITFSAPATESGKRTIKNAAEIRFDVATADQGTVTHVGIRTAATGGALIAYGALNNPRTIQTGDRFVIDLNSGVVQLS